MMEFDRHALPEFFFGLTPGELIPVLEIQDPSVRSIQIPDLGVCITSRASPVWAGAADGVREQRDFDRRLISRG